VHAVKIFWGPKAPPLRMGCDWPPGNAFLPHVLSHQILSL